MHVHITILSLTTAKFGGLSGFDELQDRTQTSRKTAYAKSRMRPPGHMACKPEWRLQVRKPEWRCKHASRSIEGKVPGKFWGLGHNTMW